MAKGKGIFECCGGGMSMDKTELMKMEGVNESECRGGWNE